MIRAADVRRLVLEHPFKPFRICLTDGRHFDVFDPTWTLVAEARLSVGIAPKDDPESELPDRHVHIDYKTIARLEPLSATKSVSI